MWTCEKCGVEGLYIHDIYQCWNAQLTTRLINDLGLRNGAVVCENCYKFLQDRKLDHYRHMKFPEFLNRDEMKL